MLALLALLACAPPLETVAPALDCAAPAAPSVDLGDGTWRNLVVISIDTFRRDAMGRYGAPDDPTPFLDALAARSIALDDHASTASWTYPSMTAVLGGRAAEEIGVLPHASSAHTDTVALPAGTPMLATWLRDAGFRQSTVTANSLIDRPLGLARDVDRVIDMEGADGELVRNAALSELGELQATGERWALHVHLTDTHAPYAPPAPWQADLDDLAPIPVDLDRFDSYPALNRDWSTYDTATQELIRLHAERRYEAAVRYTDDVVRTLWMSLEDRGALDDTVVLVVSDHGEQLWDHREWGHNRTVHRDERAAIALLWTPGAVPTAFGAPTDHTDLVPTVLPALGLDVPDVVTGLAVGDAAPDRPRVALTWPKDGDPLFALDRGCFTLHRTWDGELALYRRDLDPHELNDRTRPFPGVVASMLAELAPEIARAEALVEHAAP